jgi:hypothetical protein
MAVWGWRGEGGGVVQVERWGFRRGASPGGREVEEGKGKSGEGEVLRRVGNRVLGAWKAVRGRRGGADGVERLNKDGRRVGDGKAAAGNERRVGDTGSAWERLGSCLVLDVASRQRKEESETRAPLEKCAVLDFTE